MSKICVVVPTIRRESYQQFLKAWEKLFEKHEVTLITVWDGECPEIEVSRDGKRISTTDWTFPDVLNDNRDLFYRFTDSCRNIGFVVAAQMGFEYILTLDDDVAPLNEEDYFSRGIACGASDEFDPIQQHIDILNKRVPISWMNTAHNTDLYLRGVPYGIRDEAPTMLSHGVWVGVPDFDGETQLKLEGALSEHFPQAGVGLPYTLPYFVGPVPKGVQFPLCGMNVMVRREALPYLYYAPMGKDTGIDGLNRFGDIWMGNCLKKEFDKLGWAIYTGGATVLHTRASDARKNFEQEKLGRKWNEELWVHEADKTLPTADTDFRNYVVSWQEKRQRYAELIQSVIEKGGVK